MYKEKMAVPAYFEVAHHSQELEVGAGVPIGGYGWGVDRRTNGRVTSPLMVNCVIIVSPQGRRIALIQVDVISIPHPVYEQIRDRMIAHGVVSEAKDLIVAQSHTHYGPMVGGKPDPEVLLGSPEAVGDTNAYTTKFVDDVVNTAIGAMTKPLTEVTLGFAEGHAETASSRLDPQLPWGTWAPREVPVLVARRAGDDELFLVLVGHACHPVCAERMSPDLDADFCGRLVADIRQRLGVPAIFFQGATGDVDPLPAPEGVNRAAFVGKLLADAVVATVRDAVFSPISGPITTAMETAPLPYAVNFRDSAEVAELQQKYQDRVDENDQGEVGQAGVRHARKMLKELADGNRPKSMPMTVQKIDLGGLTILALSHEVLSGYHASTKLEHPDQRLWIMAYANHVDCYVPASDVLWAGGHLESGWQDDPRMVGVGTYSHSYSMLSPLASSPDRSNPRDERGVEGVVVKYINRVLGN
ncbi:hypothetical protein JOF56_006809 [Kibdelosporangium banguiense]|uniref:Neutral/alkaline non-lysosomal ceramidase N-terminal domain-containing protein n=1 Tax=Kibdelosporangium banguiense TaxID=1365924 RepID=A0ABS4TR19_9PSEU|nr:hypothetical protein [Kibdelosporangium banguiense]MBP2326424.1 hypothetical protein [Kibdelosporangium banguiense]